MIGIMTAKEAFATFSIRQCSTRKANIRTFGFSETLAKLEVLPATEPLLLYHIDGEEVIYTLFTSVNTQEIIGCIGTAKTKGMNNE